MEQEVNRGLPSTFLTFHSSSFVELLKEYDPTLLPAKRAAETFGEAPHGTTIVAATFAGGVLLAGDRRTTMGNLIAGRDVDKLTITDDYSAVGFAGTVGISIDMTRLFVVELEHYEKIEGVPLSLEGKSNRLAAIVKGNLPMANAGMVSIPSPTSTARPAIGMTMFGVTTTCATAVRVALEAEGLDPLVFHATGTGGRAMDKLVESKLIRGVLDITTTEVADEVVGGIFPAGPSRFDAIIESGVPYVMSLGALDMVNFRARSTVPEKFDDRLLHVHNPQITLMRTTPDENREIARWIAAKVNRSTAELAILIPEKGVSALDAPGQPFFDAEADEALFSELERCVDTTPKRTVRRLPYHINDPEFANALTGTFRSMWNLSQDGSA